MKIAVTSQIKLPVNLYGGAERVIWDLCRELNALGNEVVLVAPHGTSCDFAEVVGHDFGGSIMDSIPKDVDFIHFFSDLPHLIDSPHIFTLEGNASFGEILSIKLYLFLITKLLGMVVIVLFTTVWHLVKLT